MTRIRELREGRGLRVIDLAFETRLHPSQISCIERRKSAASGRARDILSAYFEVDADSVCDHGGLAV